MTFFHAKKESERVLLMDIKKDISVHLLVDANGILLTDCSVQSNEYDMKNVGNLIDTVAVKT